MPFCEYCGEELPYLPFRCKYCSGTFCNKHRLPENHQCSFESKHRHVVPPPSKEQQPLYQDAVTERDEFQNYEKIKAREIKKYLKPPKTQKRKARQSYTSSFSETGEAKATNFIIIMIVICSITATIFSIVGIPEYIALSVYGLMHLYLWTIFTALFVSYSPDLFGLLFLLILVIFVYNIAKTIEMRFGTKFIISLYLFCATFTALFYFSIRFMLAPIYPIESEIYIIPVGLAIGAILGLIAFIIYFNPNQEMMLLCFFVPVKMKGKTLLIVLVLFRLIPGLLFSLFLGPEYLAYYLPDLGGVLASYIVFYSKFKAKYRR